MPAWPFQPDTPPIAIAHRGGDSSAGENTIEAFDEAVGLGYRYVETDTHLTTDGVLVAFHDDVLDRLTDRRGRIAELTWPEVSRARMPGGGRIPKLEEVLTRWPELFVNIEPKHDAAVGPLVELLQRIDALGRVCIGSFDTGRLRRVRGTLGARACTSLGSIEVAHLRLHSLGLLPGPSGGWGGALAAQVPVRHFGIPVVDRRFVAMAHRQGLKVHVWTVNDRATMEHLLDLGVDAIMTDRIALLKEVFESRGLWPAGETAG